MQPIVVVHHCQSEHHVTDLTGGWTDTSLTTLGVCPRIRSWRRKPPRNNLLTVIWTLSWSN